MRSLLIQSLGRTLCLDVPDRGVAVEELKARIQVLEGVPAEAQRLSSEGRELRDGMMVVPSAEKRSAPPVLVLHFRMRGGKGGFGSLMRAYAAKLAARARRGDQDVGAMRDLNGRRVRHVEAERKIAEWKPEENKIDNASLKKTFREIQQGKRPTIYKGDCKYGVNCKYKWKCRYKHPDDEQREKADQPIDSIKKDFGEPDESNIYDGDSRTNIISAIQRGLETARKRVRPDEEKDEGDKSDEATTNNTAQVNSPKRQKVSSVADKTRDKKEAEKKLQKNGSNEILKPTGKDTAEESKKMAEKKDYGHVDLKEYSSAKDLESLGLDHLKAELMRHGLKCGGNVVQRAERLFLLKMKSYDELPKKVKAKQKK